MADESQNNPFIRNLASSDKKTRDQALESLRAFLGGRYEISELDLLKLWKGLFYCLWMQDKPNLQQALSRSFATLPTTLQKPVALPFFRTFWLTIAREWTQIEALRLDKYLYLIRQYVNVSFQYLSKNNWADRDSLREYMSILEEIPLNPVEMKIPNGLRFHVLDVWVDELEKVDSVWEEDKRMTLEVLCGPVERLAKEGKLKVIRTAAKETLGDDRLQAWRGQDLGGADISIEEGDEEEEWGGIED